MRTTTAPTPTRLILRHTFAQAAAIVLAGTIWYLACLEACSAWATAGGVSSAAHATVPSISPATVLALVAITLAIGAIGRQPRTTSAFDRLTARVDADAAQLTAVVVTAVAIAALVHSFAAPSAQAQPLSIGGVALSAYLAWRVSYNRLGVERDCRDDSRARWRREREELDQLCARHPASARSIVVALTSGIGVCAVILLSVVTTVRVVATGHTQPGSDIATALVVSVCTVGGGLFLRVVHRLADVRDALFMRHLIVAIGCATPIVAAVGTVLATMHNPAALVAALAFLLASFVPPAVLCLVRPWGAAATALALRVVVGYATRRAAMQERLLDALGGSYD